jgi:nicotinate phosphoribosyltransferase
VTNFEAKELHHDIFVDGKLVYKLPELQEIQDYAAQNMDVLWDEYKRTMHPEEYPVDLSERCWENKMRNIEEVQSKVKNMIEQGKK